MSNKILVICGPTASGKTKLASIFANEFDGELISADSRQVYKGMNIGTGKDLPKNIKAKKLTNFKYSYYEINGVKVWGYDLVGPTQNFSVSDYVKNAVLIIDNIKNRNKLPIIVGGTGFYIKALIDGVESMSIPPDQKLRKKLSNKNTFDLFLKLKELDAVRAGKMNFSDKNNPRRLIRAIEISIQKQINNKRKFRKNDSLNYEPLFIGLFAPKQLLNNKIEERVNNRMKNGFEKEVNNLLKIGITWKYRSMQSMGYRQYQPYFLKQIDKSEFIKNWTVAEQKYAKRQMTWFKSDKRINWYDISDDNFKSEVEKKIQNWYYEKEAALC